MCTIIDTSKHNNPQKQKLKIHHTQNNKKKKKKKKQRGKEYLSLTPQKKNDYNIHVIC
jgi:hypothetical protein